MPKDSFLTYENSTYGIKIQYPPDWSFEEGVSTEKDTVIAIVYLYPPIAADPNAVAYLYVGTWDLDRKTKSIDLLARHAINSWRPDQDFKLISATAQTNLAGRPAYAIVFKHLNNGFDSKTTQLGTIFDNKVYYIVFSTEAVKYDAFLPTVQKMTSSFELTPMKREEIM